MAKAEVCQRLQRSSQAESSALHLAHHPPGEPQGDCEQTTTGAAVRQHGEARGDFGGRRQEAHRLSSAVQRHPAGRRPDPLCSDHHEHCKYLQQYTPCAGHQDHCNVLLHCILSYKVISSDYILKYKSQHAHKTGLFPCRQTERQDRNYEEGEVDSDTDTRKDR